VAANLPDAIVGPRPRVADPVEDVAEDGPELVGDSVAAHAVEVERVHQLAVHVELELPLGRVADSHRRRAAVTLEVVGGLLVGLACGADAVEHLLWLIAPVELAHTAVGEEGYEVMDLGVSAEWRGRAHGEGRVADPRVAVVPVAIAADLLGQAE